jgi:hypothetical protein
VAPRILEAEDPSLDGDWKVKQVIWVRPPAWLQFYFVYFVVSAE